MTKRILTILFLSGLLFWTPQAMRAESSIEIVEQVFSMVDISVSGNVLHVTGAAGQDLYVYNVTGVRVKSFRVDSNDKRYELNLPKGCYIVKVDKVVRKISIR